MRRDPGYLLTYPTNVAVLIVEFERLSRAPHTLRRVRTIGEPSGVSWFDIQDALGRPFRVRFSYDADEARDTKRQVRGVRVTRRLTVVSIQQSW